MAERIVNRSGEELKSTDFRLIRGVIESSETIRAYDLRRSPKTGKITYSTTDCVVVLLYKEIRKTTMSGAIADLHDAGGQERLENLGMPLVDGVRRCPVESTMSKFVNEHWPRIEAALSEEMCRAVMRELSGEPLFFTCDSTPLEASRYSKRCAYNPHYEIRMDKEHILMVNGHPLHHLRTGGNDSDYVNFLRLLEKMDRVDPASVRGFSTDGAYHGFSAYVGVLLKTGKVMATNQGTDAVYHPEASWSAIRKAYGRQWKRNDYVPLKHRKPSEVLGYLVKCGKEELVGKFLHNLDLARGKAIKAQWARERHVCETVHYDAKRWIRFDVRGLPERTAGNWTTLRFFFVQLLSTVFAPF
jgi:hypothetical protein